MPLTKETEIDPKGGGKTIYGKPKFWKIQEEKGRRKYEGSLRNSLRNK
jgi:hypothetical protein